MKTSILRLLSCGVLLSVLTLSGALRADDTAAPAKDGSTCTKCHKHHHCHGKKDADKDKDKDASGTDSGN